MGTIIRLRVQYFVMLACTIAVPVFGSLNATAQSLQFKEYISDEYDLAVSFPANWSLESPINEEIWLVSGDLQGLTAACFVRVSIVPNLQFVNPDDYFSSMDENQFKQLSSISMPDIQIHLYDFSFLGGRKARRIIYSGTDSGVVTGTVVHQTLDEDKIVTLGCLTDRGSFHLLYKDFDAIAASFRFIE